MELFDSFPKTLYNLSNNVNEFKTVVDITVRVRMLQDVINRTSIYYTYDIQEGDTIETIAAKFYGDAKKHWIIYYTNQILDPYYGIPLSYQRFTDYIEDKYGSAANAQALLHHYEKTTKTTNITSLGKTVSMETMLYSNDVVQIDDSGALPNVMNPVITISSYVSDSGDGISVATEEKLIAVNAYDYENDLNESKRTIKIIKPEYTSTIENELKTLLSA